MDQLKALIAISLLAGVLAGCQNTAEEEDMYLDAENAPAEFDQAAQNEAMGIDPNADMSGMSETGEAGR
jgi:hypothetical protein